MLRNSAHLLRNLISLTRSVLRLGVVVQVAFGNLHQPSDLPCLETSTVTSWFAASRPDVIMETTFDHLNFRSHYILMRETPLWNTVVHYYCSEGTFGIALVQDVKVSCYEFRFNMPEIFKECRELFKDQHLTYDVMCFYPGGVYHSVMLVHVFYWQYRRELKQQLIYRKLSFKMYSKYIFR